MWDLPRQGLEPLSPCIGRRILNHCATREAPDVVYLYNGILFSHKKKELLPFGTIGMDLEGIMLSEISQTEKEKYCEILLIYGI